jgi:hypothetical protein
MRTIYPPNPINQSGISIFLAGTIDMGNSTDWQQTAIDRLAEKIGDKNVTIFNPRRPKWDNS